MATRRIGRRRRSGRRFLLWIDEGAAVPLLRQSGAMRSIEPGISRFRVWSFGPSRNDGESFAHQRVHVFDRVSEILLELLHYGAGRLHAVDQAHALPDEITHEVARLGVAGGCRAVDRVEGVAADDAL